MNYYGKLVGKVFELEITTHDFDKLKLENEKLKQRELELKLDYNIELISNFIEHCKENEIIIEDSIFESFFNA